ncbi:MAG TPA: tail fiber domain-containing protein, partial [Polyangia bacterium]|nr:tail fiber domain-containing protein [Polyangia bacterium]
NGAMTFAGTVMAGGGIYPDNSGQWTLYNDGNSNRVFRWQGGYLHSWSATSGALSYFVPLGNQWYFPNDGSGINWIAWVGGVGPYRDVSDERTKTDIAPAGHGLDAVLALQPILFRRWFQGKKDYADRVELGFGARQVRDVLPEAVTEVARSPRQWDAPGTPVSGDPILAVALTPIVAAVVNAVKTLHARLDVIETKGAA